MAQFSADIGGSSFPDPNILFNSASGITGQTVRQNELLNQGRQLDLSNANVEQVSRLSAGLLNEQDPAKRAELYSRGVGYLQSQGFAMHAPPTLPDEQTLRFLATQGTPSADLYKQQLGAKALDAVYPGPSASTASAGGGGTTATAGMPAAPAGGGATIGQRQNNPGNLTFAGQPGASPGQGNRFASFPDMPTGVAATANQLALYQEQHGINTVRGAVTRWVSDPKADLTSYTADVAKALGVGPDDKIDLTDPTVQAKFIQAQFPHESAGGGYVLNPADVAKGVQMAAANRGRTVQVPGTAIAVTAPAGGGGTPGRVQVASVTPTTATDGTTAAPAAPPAPLPPDQAVTQAKATGQPVPVAGSQGLWALPSGNLTSTPPPPAAPAVAPPAATPAPAATAAQPPAPPALPPDQLTPQDHTELARYKAALAASGRPDAPVLLQAEIDRRRTANVAAQHQTLEEQRQAAGDARAAEQLALSKKADARAEAEAKRAGLPTGYRLDDTGKAYRIDGLPPDPAVLEAQANAGKQAQRQFEQENTLRDEFQKLTSDFRIVQTSFENIRSAAKANDGAGDMSLLYNYVRLLDPTSVVRESEFAAAAASGSLGERVQTAYERIASGARMPESLRQSFIREGRNLYNNQLNSHNTVADQYEQLARDNGLEPKRVVTRFARPQDDGQAPPPDLSKKPPGFDKKVQ